MKPGSVALALVIGVAPPVAAPPSPVQTTSHSWILGQTGWARDGALERLSAEVEIPQRSPLLPPMSWVRVDLAATYGWALSVDAPPGPVGGSWSAWLPAASNWADGEVRLAGALLSSGDAPTGGLVLDTLTRQRFMAGEPASLAGVCGSTGSLSSVQPILGDGPTWSSGAPCEALTGYSTALLVVTATRQVTVETSGPCRVRPRLLGMFGGDPGDVWALILTVTYFHS